MLTILPLVVVFNALLFRTITTTRSVICKYTRNRTSPHLTTTSPHLIALLRVRLKFRISRARVVILSTFENRSITPYRSSISPPSSLFLVTERMTNARRRKELSFPFREHAIDTNVRHKRTSSSEIFEIFRVNCILRPGRCVKSSS